MWTWMRMFQWSVWPLSGFLPFFTYPWSLCNLFYLCHLCFVALWWFWTTLKNGMKVFRLFSSNYVWMKEQAMLEWRWNYRGLAKIWRNFDGLSLSHICIYLSSLQLSFCVKEVGMNSYSCIKLPQWTFFWLANNACTNRFWTHNFTLRTFLWEERMPIESEA